MTMTTAQILTIATTNTLEAGPGELLITANKKASPGNPIKPDDRYRSVVIKEWDLLAVCTDKVRGILFDKFFELSKEFLAANRDAGLLRADAFSVDSLLSFAQDSASSGRITNESILTWFKGTRTAAKIKAKRSDETAMRYAALYAKLSGPNSGLSKQEATVLAGNLEPEDAETRIGLFILERLEKIMNKVEAFSLELL
jgi:hypothetical protein